MQTRGTFPELNSGRKQTRRGSGRYARNDSGFGGFSVNSRAPRKVNAPRSLAGRRAASHRKAYGS